MDRARPYVAGHVQARRLPGLNDIETRTQHLPRTVGRMDLRTVNCVPRTASSIEHARTLIALDGAAILTGIDSIEAAVTRGRDVLGERAVRVRPQFEATKANSEMENAIVALERPDARGRKRDLGRYDLMQPAHYDGFAFGDFCPDHMFLWCARPCSQGGASFLVDAVRLLSLLSDDDPAFAEFAWNVDIDHSEPGAPQGVHAPIARLVAGARTQVRSHPYQAPVLGPNEAADWPFVERWGRAVAAARMTGPRFRLQAGEMICIDNYRLLHGRDAFVEPERKVVSIWAWTTSAMAVPAGDLDIVRPEMPEPALAG